jgi:transcriptional regulator with XRE-family HTH domain
MSKIRDLRIEIDLTQFELAEATGVSRGKIQLAEKGYSVLSQDEAKRILSILTGHDAWPNWADHLLSRQLELKDGGQK